MKKKLNNITALIDYLRIQNGIKLKNVLTMIIQKVKYLFQIIK